MNDAFRQIAIRQNAIERRLGIEEVLEKPHTNTAATLVVAASNSLYPDGANYICDGTADEVQINAAINALPAGANNAGTIILLEGTYTLAGPILINRNYVRLVGQGWGTYITLANSTNTNVITVGSDANYSYVEIADLRINGNYDNQSSGHGIVLNGSGHKLRRLNVQGARQDGVRISSYDASNVFEHIFDDVTIVEAGNDCFYVDSYVFNAEFIRVIAHGGKNLGSPRGRYGIYDKSTQCKFVACHPYYNVNHGFYKDAGKEAVVIGGEFENNTGAGLRLLSVIGCHIEGALFYGNGGIDINPSSCTQTRVIGNICRSTSSTGIYVSAGSRNLVLGNVVTGSLTLGIRIGDGAQYCRVDGNQVYSITSGSASIRISDSSENEITNNSTDITISESGTSNNNRIFENHISSGSITVTGAATKTFRNKGSVTENSGTATVPNGSTTVAVNHGLARTPALAEISVTPTNNLGSAAKFWISGVTSTQFTINVDVNPGASTATFVWHAHLL